MIYNLIFLIKLIYLFNQIMYFQIEYIDLDQSFPTLLDFVHDSIDSNTKSVAQKLFSILIEVTI